VAPWSVGILSNYTQTALLFLVDSRTSVHLKYSERNTQTGHLISFTTDGLHKGENRWATSKRNQWHKIRGDLSCFCRLYYYPLRLPQIPDHYRLLLQHQPAML